MVDDTVYSFKDHVILNILNLMDTNPHQFNILASWYMAKLNKEAFFPTTI